MPYGKFVKNSFFCFHHAFNFKKPRYKVDKKCHELKKASLLDMLFNLSCFPKLLVQKSFPTLDFLFVFCRRKTFCFILASALKYPFTTRRKVSISPERRQSFRLKVMFCCVYLVLLSLQLFSDLHKHFHVFTSHDWKYVVSHISFLNFVATSKHYDFCLISSHTLMC